MPTYDYRCTACGARFEAWQKFSDEPIRVCPTCSGPAQRVIHAPAITFKGSGFYITDSKGSGASPAASADSGDSGAGNSESAAAKASEPAKTGSESAASAPTSAEPAKAAPTPPAKAS
jgi:putative FmdB family regulatory protein